MHWHLLLLPQHASLMGSRSEKGWSSRSLGARCRNSIASCSDEQPHIGNYRLLKTIGKGNFAKVKLARHILTGREVRLVHDWIAFLIGTQLLGKPLKTGTSYDGNLILRPKQPAFTLMVERKLYEFAHLSFLHFDRAQLYQLVGPFICNVVFKSMCQHHSNGFVSVFSGCNKNYWQNSTEPNKSTKGKKWLISAGDSDYVYAC